MKKIFSIALTGMLLFACSKDHSGDAGRSDGTEAEVSIMLSVDHVTRAPINAEKTINTVDLLVFKRDETYPDNSDKATYQYTRYAWQKSSDEYRATLLIDEHIDIYFAINVRSLLPTITEGESYSAVHERLLLTATPDNLVKDKLPMWGYKPDTFVSESAGIHNLGRISLLRSVASVDVSIKDETFSFIEGTIVFATNKGYIAHRDSDVEKVDPDRLGQVNILHVPESAGYEYEWTKPATMPGGFTYKTIENTFYLYENDADGTTNHYSKLIVKGIYKANEGNTRETYYPLAFRNGENNEKIQTARNRKFIIIVNEVNGDGYDTLEEAKNAEDVNMDYEVIEWDETNDTDIIIDGPNYVSFNPRREAKVADLEGADVHVFFTSNAITWNTTDNLPANVTLSFDNTFSDSTTSLNGSTTNDYFSVKLVNDAPNSYYFYVKALEDLKNYSAVNYATTLYVKFGRINFSLPIQQCHGEWNGTDEDITLED